MGKQSYAEYLDERGAGLIPSTPADLDERETQIWNQCIDLIRDHLGNDETRWPERYQEAGKVFALLAKGLDAFTWAHEWQPIETAPKQKKVIAGYFNPLGKWRSVMARYYVENELEWHDQSPNYGEGFAPEGWYELCETHEDILPADCEPTHWMLLPAPPKAIEP